VWQRDGEVAEGEERAARGERRSGGGGEREREARGGQQSGDGEREGETKAPARGAGVRDAAAAKQGVGGGGRRRRSRGEEEAGARRGGSRRRPTPPLLPTARSLLPIALPPPSLRSVSQHGTAVLPVADPVTGAARRQQLAISPHSATPTRS